MQTQIDAAKDDTRELGERIAVLEEELREVDGRFDELMLWVPNIPDESVPVGPDDSYNIAYEPQGAPLPVFDFEPKPHWDLGPELDIIDFEQGVTLSGSRFYVLRGAGARLQRALIQFMLNSPYRPCMATPRSIRRSWCGRRCMSARGSCQSLPTTSIATRKRISCGWARPKSP